jgi:hypothetical protein
MGNSWRVREHLTSYLHAHQEDQATLIKFQRLLSEQFSIPMISLFLSYPKKGRKNISDLDLV